MHCILAILSTFKGLQSVDVYLVFEITQWIGAIDFNNHAFDLIIIAIFCSMDKFLVKYDEDIQNISILGRFQTKI